MNVMTNCKVKDTKKKTTRLRNTIEPFTMQAEILELIYKLKRSEYRGEQAEMNIQRLNVRIDQVCIFFKLNVISSMLLLLLLFP